MSGERPRVPLWWLTLTDPLPDWEVDDLQQMRELIAEKPPNREMRNQIILGYFAGLLQGRGKLGYLEITDEEKTILTPFITISGDKEAIELMERLIGEVQEKILSKNQLTITITGLRAIILLRMISPYLRGPKRILAEKFVEAGYKISNRETYQKIVKELGVREEIKDVQKRPLRIRKIQLNFINK